MNKTAGRNTHSRTQSIQGGSSSFKKTHSRQTSLPPLPMSPHTGTSLDSTRSTTMVHKAQSRTPEKNTISIQIAHPKSDPLHVHKLRHESVAANLFYILLWYSFSTLLSLYNKNLMGRDQFNFNFPLLVSAIHAGLHALITFVMVSVGRRWTPKSRVTMSTSDYIWKVVPCGVAAALEICCANASLVYITLSFYTMVKSCTPIFVLIFSILFGFERPRLGLISIIVVMVVGVILTVEGETKFDLVGFLLVLFAAVVSGLRWNLTQLLLHQDQLGISDPIATLYYLSPIMFVTMLFLSMLFENPVDQFRQSKHFDSIFHVMESFGLMAIGGLLAFAMTLAELALIKSTNTVTLSVAGVSKEIVIIGLSVIIYGDELTSKNLLGLFVSVIGIVAYNYYKLHKSTDVQQSYNLIPMHGSGKRNLVD